jgi:hypothetical protein
MAKNTETNKKVKIKVRRKGVHAKTKMSSLKSSKNYTKKNVGQGK